MALLTTPPSLLRLWLELCPSAQIEHAADVLARWLNKSGSISIMHIMALWKNI